MVAVCPGFDIEHRSTSVGGEVAEVLDMLPGQDINRRVILVHNGLPVASGRTANEAADELIAGFHADYSIERLGGLAVGYEPAKWLDDVPGQN